MCEMALPFRPLYTLFKWLCRHLGRSPKISGDYFRRGKATAAQQSGSAASNRWSNTPNAHFYPAYSEHPRVFRTLLEIIYLLLDFTSPSSIKCCCGVVEPTTTGAVPVILQVSAEAMPETSRHLLNLTQSFLRCSTLALLKRRLGYEIIEKH